ncbi:MAG: phospho-N-acetylmuramoyl-pentapeptide-transferase [Parcubacteria group bacterium]
MILTQIIKVFAVTITAFFIAIIITPVILKLLRRFGIKKQIRDSSSAPIMSALHAKKEGTPTMGGVIIWGTVLTVALIMLVAGKVLGGIYENLNFINRAETYLPLVAMIIAAVVGLADDLLGVLRIGPKGGGLTIRYKLILYTLVGALGAWWFYSPNHLDWHILNIPFVGAIDIGFWYIPIFIFIIVASAFSANETDGLDGLLSGVSISAFAALGVIAFVLGRYNLAAMTGAFIGAMIAFLWNNVYPTKFFMGDTGSMAIGITMGIISLLTNTVFLLPFFAVVMVIESLSVIIQMVHKRLLKRKLFLSTPIHHHFEAKGMPESQITMRFWIISGVSAGIGLVLFFLDRII